LIRRHQLPQFIGKGTITLIERFRLRGGATNDNVLSGGNS